MANDRVLGVDIGARSIKIAEADLSGDRPLITAFTTIPLPFGCIEDGLVVTEKRRLIVDALRAGLNSGIFQTKDAIIGLNSPNSVFFHQIAVPAMTDEDIRKAKEHLVAAADTGLDIEHQQIDYSVLGRRPKGNKIDVLFYFVHDSVAQTMCEIAEEAGLEVVGADLSVLATLRGADISHDPTFAEAIINIGADTQSILIHRAGVPLFLYGDTSMTGNAASRAVAEAMSLDYDDEDVETAKLSKEQDRAVASALADYSLNLADRVANAFTSYARTVPDAPEIMSIRLVGGGSMLNGLARAVINKTNKRAQYAAPDPLFEGDLSRATLHLTALGLTTGAQG